MNKSLFKFIMVVTVISSLALIGCIEGQKEIDQNGLKGFFSKNRVGKSIDYAVMKNGTDHLMTIHGYADDRSVCLQLIEPYNRDASLSVLSGTYECVPLNK